MTYKIKAHIIGTHPTESLATLGDIIHFIDTLAEEYSSKRFIEPEDLPITIQYQGEQNNPDNHYKQHSFLHIYRNSDPSNDPIMWSNWKFPPGSVVYHKISGQRFIIRAVAYYHASKRFTSLCVSSDEILHIYPEDELVSYKTIAELLEVLVGPGLSNDPCPFFVFPFEPCFHKPIPPLP